MSDYIIKIKRTLFSNCYWLLHEYILIPLIISLSAAIVYLLISKKKKCISIKNAAITFSFFFYFTLIIQSALISRFMFHGKMNATEKIWGGWFISEGQFYFDFSSIENILVFMPIGIVTILFFKYVLNIKITKKLRIAVIFALPFLFSCFIEITQLIFSIGTFQFSDIFYNTLGGVIGALLFNLIIKKRKQLKS